MSREQEITISQLRQTVLGFTKILPEAVRADVAERLTKELLTDPDSRTARGPISRSLTERDTYYAVPGEELNLAKTAVGIAAGIAAVVKDPLSLLGSLCVFLFQFRRKAVKLDKNEGMVVLTLIDRSYREDGLNTEELTDKLPSELGLSVEDVTVILEGLKKKRRQGKSTPVVREYNGKWWG